VTARKIIGLLVAILGIATGAFLSGIAAILFTAYLTEPHSAGSGGLPQIAAAGIGALIGYGLYRLGRYIAR